MSEPELKRRTAGSLKWNAIDKVCQQLLYAVTGVVLARVLSQEDFGLVGAALVFQAFALLLVDSGFSYALLQRKAPTRLDYSSVLWFNLAMATALYIALWFMAPWIASLFGGDPRLVPISRVIFLSMILNAGAIVQTNQLMKRMDVRMVALANATGLFAGSVVGIWLALAGTGAWAIVAQTLTLGTVKGALLWATGRWRPLWRFSWASLRSFVPVGSGMMLTSFLNVLFQNIYAFFIGHGIGLVSLGYYTQSDKWSKMGVTSIAQVLTQSFLPTLAVVQDDRPRFLASVSKMNRLSAYVAIPAMGFLIVMATPIFHALFGTKWDPSIILFQLLLVKGIFYIFTNLYTHYILALGRSRVIVYLEALRDGVAAIALVCTLPYLGYTTPTDPVAGIAILLWGQVAASAVAAIATFVVAVRMCRASWLGWLRDIAPYLAETIVIMYVMWLVAQWLHWLSPLPILCAQAVVALALYLGINALLGSVIQSEAIAFIARRR